MYSAARPSLRHTHQRPSSRRLRIALGTWVAVEASAGTPAEEEVAIDAAYAAIAEVDRRMHPHREDSDVARINSTPAGSPIEVHPDTRDLLRLALRIHVLSEGIFDPCLPTLPGRLSDIEIGESGLVCHVPVELDLGGIAKGYAIDRAIDRLTERGCRSGVVNAGGDLRIFGETQAFVLRTGNSVRTLELTDAALAVSDLDAQDKPEEHRGYYSRRGSPSPKGYAAVIASTAATADALTKCVLFGPDTTSARVLRELEAKSI